ncbi:MULTISPECIES: hypothetical protein [Hyphomicrobiales]|jgi:hypothetical protein|uniref:Uncharacterized protein n=1 Tax=Bosea massiliensis TaxID=151419 RepID=A0ABW0NUQ2_9HYPH|nr:MULTISPECIES: hypothetical protein [Hyphomicrobiales]MCZ8043289.1 hypothetical protein [Beijerinckiaceae bacterium]MDP3258424.1 hypothetical protein [Bosea sp. (in: a-proteobacteria)]HEV2554543.1 hypothetical protein [Bosea sp. (in: a-proteobacteria)]
MTKRPASEHGRLCVVRREANLRRMPTTQGFAALHDHARLPWRFFGRFTASIAAGLSRA